MLGLITEIHRDVKQIDSRLSAHIQDEVLAFESVLTRIAQQAFPHGDADGHRRRHEADLQKLEARAEFWKKMSYQLTEKGLLAFLAWLIYVVGKAVWFALLVGPIK